MGDQQQGGVFLHSSELPTSISSCLHSPEGNQIENREKENMNQILQGTARRVISLTVLTRKSLLNCIGHKRERMLLQ